MFPGNKKSAQQIYCPTTSKWIWPVWDLKKKKKIKEPNAHDRSNTEKIWATLESIHTFLLQILYSCSFAMSETFPEPIFFCFSLFVVEDWTQGPIHTKYSLYHKAKSQLTHTYIHTHTQRHAIFISQYPLIVWDSLSYQCYLQQVLSRIILYFLP